VSIQSGPEQTLTLPLSLKKGEATYSHQTRLTHTAAALHSVPNLFSAFLLS
jgi:hypothetical protein